MTTQMSAQMLVDDINNYYKKETVYLSRKDFGKCYMVDGGHEIGRWGLSEWASRILTHKEIGDISQFIRVD